MLTKFDKKVPKPNNLEILGHCMYESGNDLGQNTLYGNRNIINACIGNIFFVKINFFLR